MKPKVLLVHLGINTAITLLLLALTVPPQSPLHTGLVEASIITRCVVLAAFVSILQGLAWLGLRRPGPSRSTDDPA